MKKSKHSFNLISAKAKWSFESPIVMGILNLTPDSFYKGSRVNNNDALLKQAEKMLNEGARIIDVGGVSTRPGAKKVEEEEELNRIIGSVKSLVDHFPEAIISVDTFRSKVAQEAVSAGAHMINDISGGTFDPEIIGLIARLQVPYIMMHIKGTPQNMQKDPQYKDVVSEVKDFFKKQLERFREAGVKSSIILDPGFGFGKTLDHNYQLMAGLDDFHSLGCPLLIGVSRKSMINHLLDIKPEDALNGTTVLNTLALLKGASILRVHDVKEAREAVKLVGKYYDAENN